MMLAIGMLVDNAVVVTESVFRHRQMDPGNPQAATLAGVKEVGVATLAGTATCVVVFLPILFSNNNQISIWLTHVAVPICVAMLRCEGAGNPQRTPTYASAARPLAPRLARNLPQCGACGA